MISDRRKETLTVVREVRATPERVFRALTEPEELMRWWGVGGLTGAKVNLRPGGEYRFEFTGPRGESVWVKGQYQAVEPPRRVAMTWFSSTFPDLRNSVEIRLEDAEAGTRLTLVHGGLAGRPEVFDECKAGWEEALGLLAGSMG